MSLTLNEAVDRAYRIWEARHINVRLRRDGGADLDFTDDSAQTARGARDAELHRLDANGHVACGHKECLARERHVDFGGAQ